MFWSGSIRWQILIRWFPVLVIFILLRTVAVEAQDHSQGGNSIALSGSGRPAGHSEPEAELSDLLRRKEWNKAAALGEELLREHPGNPAYSYGLGVARLSLNDPIGAIQAMRSAELHGLNTARLHLSLGLAYYVINQYLLFREQMDKAIALDPNSFEPHYYMGRYLESILDDVPGALKWFDKAVQLNPGDAKSWYHKGYCYKELGREAEAQNAFKTAIELGKNVDEHFSLPYQGMAQSLLETDPKQALQFARQAIEREPNLESNHLVTAKIYERLSQLAEAEAELQAAIKLDPTDASARFMSSRIYNRLGNHEAAKAELEGFKKVNQLYGAQ